MTRVVWDTTVPDWQGLILAGKTPLPKLPLFDREAEKALRIFKRLKCPDMEGNPPYGEICSEWVFDLVRVIFGSYDAALKRRMIREFFILIPKKNGKSSIAAAIMVVAVIMNRRPEAECLLVAPTKKIADIAYKQAAGIIRLDDALRKLFYPQAHQRTITHRLTLASIMVKAADTDVITGGKATFSLIDETHVFAKMARAADVFTEIRGALAARPDGFLLQISTQSKEPPSGVFLQELSTARDVRDGKIDLPLVACIYEYPPAILKDEGWRAQENWRLVNPNLGRSVDEAFLSDEMKKAERGGDEAMALFASQHFNIEIGIALHASRWEGVEFWQPQAIELTLEEIIARSDVCTVGIDGGGLDDLLGLSILGRDKKTRDWLHWSHAWAHRKVLERHEQIAPAMKDFESEGSLTIYDVPGDDVEALVDFVMQVETAGLLPEKEGIGVDAVGISEIVDELQVRGITAESQKIVAVSQGWKLANTIKTTARRLAACTMWHGGSRLMTWAVGNARVEPRGNAILITKQVSAGKIDPLMATFNAIALMAKNPNAGQFIYEGEGRDLRFV